MGRNATGGSVNVITKGPSEELLGDIRVTLGSENMRELEGGISGSLSDNLTGRVAFISSERDGFEKNVVTGNDVLDRDEAGNSWKITMGSF